MSGYVIDVIREESGCQDGALRDSGRDAVCYGMDAVNFDGVGAVCKKTGDDFD